MRRNKKDKLYNKYIENKNSLTYEIFKNGFTIIFFGFVFYLIYKYVIPLLYSFCNEISI